MMKIRWHALKGHPEAFFLALDLLLMLLISINLLWLLLDAILMSTGSGVLLARHFPELMSHYRQHWHETLLVYDSYFTFFLIGELLLRWAIAIWRKTYYRWFFYPFVHWYDVLGSLPLASFRFLRLLRLISIALRLQKIGVVDLSQASIISLLQKYYRIVIEELSDRIVINVLEGVQREIRSGSPLSRRLTADILQPHQDVIVPWLADLLSASSAHAYARQQELLTRHLELRLHQAIARSPEFQKLKRRLLFAGPSVEEQLHGIVSEILTQLVHGVLTDLGQPGNAAAHHIADGIFASLHAPASTDMDSALRAILLDAIDLIKDQVSVQQWKASTNGSPATPQP